MILTVSLGDEWGAKDVLSLEHSNTDIGNVHSAEDLVEDLISQVADPHFSQE